MALAVVYVVVSEGKLVSDDREEVGSLFPDDAGAIQFHTLGLALVTVGVFLGSMAGKTRSFT